MIELIIFSLLVSRLNLRDYNFNKKKKNLLINPLNWILQM